MSAAAGFVATKPLQMMTSMIVARTAVTGPSTLAVVPDFADGAAIVDRVRRAGAGFATVRAHRDRVRAILALAVAGVPTIYLDSDVGLRTPLAMRLARTIRPGIRFAVYEEGVSLLHPQPRDMPGPLAQRLGATMTLGQDAATDEVWTYAPVEEVRRRLPRKTVHRIELPITKFIELERRMLIEVFWPSFERDRRAWRGRRCRLYMSSWKVEERVLQALTTDDAYTVVKLHPHHRGAGVPDLPSGIDQVAEPSIPAELLVLALSEAFDEVEVLHHDSSTERYLRLPTVRFVDLPEPGSAAEPVGEHAGALSSRPPQRPRPAAPRPR